MNNIENFYPLSPIQQGILFHSLYAPDSDIYLEQLSCALHGDLNLKAFQQAWEQTVNRHAALRTSFVYQGLKEPVQLVHKQVMLDWHQEDWTDLSAQQQLLQLDAFLLHHRSRGFDLSSPPLLRFALLRLHSHSFHFVWSWHHLLVDGWSIPLLLNDVFSFYNALCSGSPLALPHVRPYRDYIAWLRSQELNLAEAFWRQTLRGFLRPTRLLIDEQPAQALSTSSHLSAQEYRSSLSSHQTAGLLRVAQQIKVTLNTIAQGAWAIALSRFSREQDVVFGAVVAGRPVEMEGVEQMVGMFVNTLPVRVKVEGAQKVDEWLRQLQKQQVEARQYEYSPLVKVQGWSEMDRGVPLFDTIMAFENYPVDESVNQKLGSLKISDIRSVERTNYSLALTVRPGAELLIQATYDTRRFDAESIKRMMGHLEMLLEAIAQNPHSPLAHLPMLTIEEMKQLQAWNQNASPYDSSLTIGEMIERQGDQRGDSVAVVSGELHLTYRQMNRRANQLSRYMRRLGVGPEQRVGVLMSRGAEMVETVVGVLKSGAGYVPLDADYPLERLDFMMRDAGVSLLLTEHHLADDLSIPDTRIECLDLLWESLVHECDENPATKADQDNLAYIIYTSGSTGKPKGVTVSHSNFTCTLQSSQTKFHFTADDVMPVLASFSFDISLLELMLPLISGGTALILRKEEILDLPVLAEKLTRVTWLHAVPSLMQQLVNHIRASSEHHYNNLRVALTGGDVVPASLLDEMKLTFTHSQIHVLYGPTEASIICSSFLVSPLSQPRHLIGKPLPNSSIWLCDPHGHLAPIGVPAEICIAGQGIARGYLNQPHLTAVSFTSIQGQRAYRTGDLGRYLPDGNIEFLGRLDHQVKIRGFRIELAEVEAAIRLHHLVSDCVVVSSSSPGADSTSNRLVAYVVSDMPAHVLSSSLREWLKLKLPDFMLPSLFIPIPRLPLTTNGKLDRKALPPPDSSGSASRPGFQAARTPVEQQLVSIWSDVLGVASPGINDNFFDLGGHSLLATQLISRLRLVFNLDLDLKLVFDSPTILEQASFIHLRLADADPSHSSPQILAVPRLDPLPLSFAQQRLWFLDQLDPHSFAYNISCAVLLSGHLNLLALRHSINHIIRRHESLRTSFDSLDGKPVQIISQQFDLDIEVVDLSELAESRRQPSAVQLAGELGRQSFDLCRLPLLRACVFKLDDLSHMLAVTLHHIISDGWSMGLIVKELASLYNAFAEGRQPLLDPLPIQYGDYAVWQRQWLSGQLLDRQLCYWKQQLAGPLPVLQMPTDRPRPPSQSFKGSSVALRLKPELALQLKAMARREGVTLYMLLLAAFYSLLFRYTSEPDIILGTPVANRALPEVEGLIGFFVNTLAIRVRMEPDQPFASLLSMVRQQCLGAYANQDVPFEKLVAELQPERSLSHSPLFQVLFAFQQQVIRSAPMRGLDLEQVELTSGISKFDLSLSFTEQAHHLEGVLEYSSELFDEQSMWRMMGHLEVLLEAIAQNPLTAVAHLPMLTIEEMKQLQEWNQNASPYDSSLTIGEMIERQGDQRGDSVAVVSGELHLTYRQMNRRANQLSRYMRRLGVGPEQRVGVLMSRGAEMVEAVVAVLKSGAAYVPLDFEYPLERLDFMMRDGGVSLLLTQSAFKDIVPQYIHKTFFIDDDWEKIDRSRDDYQRCDISPRNLAYLIYTSGTSGTPKAVQIEHCNLINTILASKHKFGINDQDVMLCLASPVFDISLFELLPILVAGGTAKVLTKYEILDIDTLSNSLEQVSLFHAVPSLMRQIIDRIKDTQQNREWSNLRMIFTGGDVVPASLLDEMKLTFTHSQIHVLYGPTEASIICSSFLVSPLSQPRHLIGKPLPNSSIWLCDPHGHLAPIGVPAEICIAGQGIARGYLNQPHLTAVSFTSIQGQRAYRTGDLGRYLPDGNIEFLGRLDHQVKIRGFRIELAEVEAAIRLHHLVSDCVVVSSSSPGTDSSSNRLVAYVVSDIAAHVLSTSLREWLKLKLPDFMLPSLFISIPGLPLTSNGKLDRKALPPADSSGSASQLGFQAARTPVEQQLVSIWSEVLGVASPGINDNFFDLGGHSLLATQLISRLRLVFKLDLDLKLVFDSPTILEQASFIHLRLADSDPSRSSPQILPVPRLDPLPLSFAQQRLWFLDQLDPHSFAYNISCAVLLSGQLNLLALRHSINHIIRRHESLRTSFDSLDGKPVQIISQQFDLDIEVIDLSELAESQRQPSALQLAGELGRQGFDLCRLPLLRACLFKLDDLSHILAVTLHHIISDGWSMGLIVKELASLYNAFAEGRQPLLEPLPIQYGDYAVWQRQWLCGQLLDRQLCYWKQQLAGPLPVLQMPTDRPRPPSQSFKGSSVPLRLKPELTHQLKALARREGVTLYMLLLAAFYSLLFRHTSEPDIIIGTDVAGRSRREVEGLIGFFVNQLVLRVKLSADLSFREVLKRVKEVCLAAYANQDVPFEKLVAELQPERSLSHHPLFQIKFLLQNAPLADLELSGLTIKPLSSDDLSARIDLTFSARETSEGLIGAFVYNTDLFYDSTIEWMRTHYLIILEAVLDEPDTQLSNLRLLTDEETGGRSAVDFPDAEMSQGEFENVILELSGNLNNKPAI